MTDLMGVAAKADESIRELMRALIIEAYDKPHYNTAAVKAREIDDFANEVALQCYKGRG